LVLLFFILDYVSKVYIVKHIPYQHSINVINNFFNIVNIHNRGVAFGAFAKFPESYRILFLCGISFLAFLIILYLILFSKDRKCLYILGLSLLGGGAAGNLYGRIVNGYVVDFLDFYFKQYHYPAFNLADSFITVGVFVLLLSRLPRRT